VVSISALSGDAWLIAAGKDRWREITLLLTEPASAFRGRDAPDSRRRYRDDLFRLDDFAQSGLLPLANRLPKLSGSTANSRKAREAAIAAMHEVSIPDPARRVEGPASTSAGCASADDRDGLACDPKLLIADEPTTALDVTIRPDTGTAGRTKKKPRTGGAIDNPRPWCGG
jgi:ABC-type dipeptide/oligopeptide/nickel transport system ATPase component